MENQNIGESFNSQPPLPQKTSNKKVVAFFVIIFVILVGAGALVFLSFSGKNKKTTPPQTTTDNTQSNLATEQAALLTTSKITVPDVTQADDIATSTLPADVGALIRNSGDKQPENVEAQKVTYSTQGLGYKIKYSLAAADMPSLYFSFTEKPTTGWQTIYRTRSSYFSLIEIEDGSYQARISLSMPQPGAGQVDIAVVSK